MKTHKYFDLESHKKACPKYNRTTSDMVCEDCLIYKAKKVKLANMSGYGVQIICEVEKYFGDKLNV